MLYLVVLVLLLAGCTSIPRQEFPQTCRFVTQNFYGTSEVQYHPCRYQWEDAEGKRIPGRPTAPPMPEERP